jgi:hypothetical protein
MKSFLGPPVLTPTPITHASVLAATAHVSKPVFFALPKVVTPSYATAGAPCTIDPGAFVHLHSPASSCLVCPGLTIGPPCRYGPEVKA